MSQPLVLDATAGSRMFWLNRSDPRALYADKRYERHLLPDSSHQADGQRLLVVEPDLQCDFTALPFANDSFALVVFDPPHLVRCGKRSWLGKKYGKLEGPWQDDLRLGFAECFRVLRPLGTLIFKWNECQVPLSQILPLTPEKPLIGQRGGRTGKTHWLVFLKPERSA